MGFSLVVLSVDRKGRGLDDEKAVKGKGKVCLESIVRQGERDLLIIKSVEIIKYYSIRIEENRGIT